MELSFSDHLGTRGDSDPGMSGRIHMGPASMAPGGGGGFEGPSGPEGSLSQPG